MKAVLLVPLLVLGCASPTDAPPAPRPEEATALDHFFAIDDMVVTTAMKARLARCADKNPSVPEKSAVAIPERKAATMAAMIDRFGWRTDRVVGVDLETTDPLHVCHFVRVGPLFVASREDLGAVATEPLDVGPVCSFLAFDAPGEGLLALLERATGRHIEHGDAPITLGSGNATLLQIHEACALASRCRGRPAKPLAPLWGYPLSVTLLSGRELTLDFRASLWNTERPLALVNGRVLGEGEELFPGLRLVKIRRFVLTFDDRGHLAEFNWKLGWRLERRD